MQVTRKWQIQCWLGQTLEWSQEFNGTRGEAEMALEAYRKEGERLGLKGRTLKLSGGKRL